jgi:hypothetical protein
MHEAISQTITPAAPFCVDGPIERRCGEIIRILDMWAAGDRTNAGYELACRQIENAAEKGAPMRSSSPDGMRAKARAVLRLNGASMARASGRLLAGSLARDVLGGEG